MKLTKIDIKQNGRIQKQAKALYCRAFPKEERLPWWLLRLNARRQGIDLTAFLDGNVFCGFTASVTVEGMHFLLFLAIEDALRGKGYGSAILTDLRQTYDTIVLNIEPLTEAAPNYAERQNRFAFYQKNGFFDTGYYVWEVGGMFRVLSTDMPLDMARYKQIFRKLSLGIWNVRLQKAD